MNKSVYENDSDIIDTSSEPDVRILPLTMLRDPGDDRLARAQADKPLLGKLATMYFPGGACHPFVVIGQTVADTEHPKIKLSPIWTGDITPAFKHGGAIYDHVWVDAREVWNRVISNADRWVEAVQRSDGTWWTTGKQHLISLEVKIGEARYFLDVMAG